MNLAVVAYTVRTLDLIEVGDEGVTSLMKFSLEAHPQSSPKQT
jgi:hypothetical protein